jgi:hypothetical protein
MGELHDEFSRPASGTTLRDHGLRDAEDLGLSGALHGEIRLPLRVLVQQRAMHRRPSMLVGKQRRVE